MRGLLHNFTDIEQLLYTQKDIEILTLSETHICAEEDNENINLNLNLNFYLPSNNVLFKKNTSKLGWRPPQ